MNNKDYTIYLKTTTYETIIHLVNKFCVWNFECVRHEEKEFSKLETIGFNTSGEAIAYLLEKENVLSFEIVK